MNRVLALVLALLAALSPVPGWAETTLTGDIRQGTLILGRTDPGSKVALDGRALRVSPEGAFVFGFARDHAKPAALTVTAPGAKAETRMLQVARRDYLIQKIDNLPKAMVTPPPETLERIKREQALLNAARKVDSPETWFADGFHWPVLGIVSGVYGSQRVLNGEPRAPHLGVDVARPTGTPVAASTAGRVTLAEPDLYFTGGTIILDHGHGVNGIYMHLSKIDVAVGQIVRQGEVIGAVGATGRVTGPHLHWGLYWFDRAVDPQPLVGDMPK